MKLLYTFLLFFIVVFSVAGQKPSKKELLAVEHEISRSQYESALVLLAPLMEKYAKNPRLYLKKGYCLFNINSRSSEAIPYLEFAKAHLSVDSWNNKDAIEASFYLGRALHLNYRFEEAIIVFNDLKTRLSTKDVELLQKINWEIGYNQNALLLKNNPVDFKITNLGPNVNGPYDEHSPVVSADEYLLMYTSNRLELGENLKSDGTSNETIYQSLWREGKWLPAESGGVNLKTDENNATCSMSADGQSLIVYRHDGISGDLYHSSYETGGWGKPQKLPRPINSIHQETHGALSENGQLIIFTSDRPGGYGGVDLYMSRKLPNGEWGKVINLGPVVNSSKDEESPFLFVDNKTLYFASEGHNSMGGYDIFKTMLNDSNQWTKPVNVGYPINTPGDDVFYIPTADGQRVYFASERAGGYGKSDLYLMEFPSEDDNRLAVIAGFIFDNKNSYSYESQIIVERVKTNELVGSYRVHPTTGRYMMILAAGETYCMRIVTAGYEECEKMFVVPGKSDFNTIRNPFYLEPIVLKKVQD